MVDQHSSRPAAAHTTAPVVTSSLYEAAFSTLGRNPQAGIALARTEEQARQHLADMLLLCDPAAAVTADIVEFTRAGTVAHYTGTADDLFAQFTTGAPARAVIARRLTNDTTTPTAGQR